MEALAAGDDTSRDARGLLCDAAPVAATLLGAALQRAFHPGVEVGLLTLLAVTLLLPVLRRVLSPGSISVAHAGLAAAATVAGPAAAFLYPFPLAVPAALLLASIVICAAAGLGTSERLTARDALVLAVILGLNLAFRQAELATAIMAPYPHFDLGTVLDRGAWRVLLPLELADGATRWMTTGLVLVAALERVFGSHVTFQLLNQWLVIVAFGTSWLAFRSRVFSFTLALCLALGTQLHYAYVNGFCHAGYLLSGYLLINLLCVWMLATGAPRPRRWRVGFVASLWLVALSWEMWLDYAAFLIVGLGLVWLDRRSTTWPARRPVARFVSAWLAATLVVYLPCKLLLGGAAEHTRTGNEGEVVLTYFERLPLADAVTMTTEDVLVNVMTYNHIALTTYLPPCFVSSASLQRVEPPRLLEQHAGHGVLHDRELAPRLVLHSYLFLWRFLAGASSLALYYALLQSVRTWWQVPTALHGVVVALLLLIALGASTHLIIKFRFYNAVPLLAYKCVVSVIGVSLLIPFVAMRLRERMRPERFQVALVLLWLLIAYGAVVRPPFLNQLCGLMGLATYIPDPWANAMALLERAVPR